MHAMKLTIYKDGGSNTGCRTRVTDQRIFLQCGSSSWEEILGKMRIVGRLVDLDRYIFFFIVTA
jgi:hypothetical protein